MMFKHIFEKRQLAKKLQQLLPFSTHQIYLGNGLWTMDKGVIAEKDLRTKVVLDQAGGSLRGKTILDLGCLEGGFTVAFARLGAKMSVGVEARQISYQRCEILRQYLKLRNLRFIHGDINVVLPQLQPFNIVFASGILYHMADPYISLRQFMWSVGTLPSSIHISHSTIPLLINVLPNWSLAHSKEKLTSDASTMNTIRVSQRTKLKDSFGLPIETMMRFGPWRSL